MSDTEKSFEELKSGLKELTPADIAEGATSLVVHHCVAAVVVAIAHNLMPTTTKKEKIQLYVASRAVSGMVADKAAKRMAKKAYKTVAFVTELVNKYKTWETATNESTEVVQTEPEE